MTGLLYDNILPAVVASPLYAPRLAGVTQGIDLL
jgi:hypothetical protein